MPRAPDLALRRIVADLAQAPIEDVEAVLEELEPRQRERVHTLLLEYHGEITPPLPKREAPAAKAVAVVSAIPGLSPWLAVRLEHSALATLVANDEDGAGSAVLSLDQVRAWRMTPAALAALQDVAREVQPEIPAPPMGPAPRGRRSRPLSGVRRSRLWPA